jgi:hypothetical protein
MRVIIVCSKEATEQDRQAALQACPWLGFVSAVVVGVRPGTETFAERWAKERQLAVVRVDADWTGDGHQAAGLRAERIAPHAQGLIVIWNGQSSGIRRLLDVAETQGLRVSLFRTDTKTVDARSASGAIEALWEQAEERAAIRECDAGQQRREAERDAGAAAIQKAMERSDVVSGPTPTPQTPW